MNCLPLQPSPTYFAPIHIAVKRGLVDTVEYLLSHGADANAVAAADAMPLTLAEALVPSSDKDAIVDLLLRKYGSLFIFCLYVYESTFSSYKSSPFPSCCCGMIGEPRTHGAPTLWIVHHYPKLYSNPFQEVVQ